MNSKIRNHIINTSISIWLNWKDTTLINRIKNSKKRPLATKLNIVELKKLIVVRSKIYNSSDYKINCDKLKKNQIVKKIIEVYDKS